MMIVTFADVDVTLADATLSECLGVVSSTTGDLSALCTPRTSTAERHKFITTFNYN